MLAVPRICFYREHGAVGNSAQEIGQVVNIGRIHAAADGHPVHHQRALVDATANEALDRLEAAHVVDLKLALNASSRKATDGGS